MILGLVVLIIAVGCSSGDEDSGKKTNSAWLTRKVTPQSEFSPVEIEATLDKVATALNQTKPQVGMKMAFVPKVIDAFFEQTTVGANRAFAELDILGNVFAPNEVAQDEAVNVQQSLMDEQIAAGTVNFGLAPYAAQLDTSIDAAVAAGGTVITFDSDAPNSTRQLYVGTINTEAGKTAGNTMLGFIGAATKGTVVIYGFDDPGWKDGYDRTHEAANVLTAAGHTAVFVHSNWGDPETGEAELVTALETADPPAVGCLGMFNISYQCADAVATAGMQSQVKVVAFDTELKTMEYMNQGLILATHVQRVYYMGYLVPYLIYSINNLGLAQTKALLSDIMVDDYRVDTGLDVIPADGIDAYNAFQSQLGAL